MVIGYWAGFWRLTSGVSPDWGNFRCGVPKYSHTGAFALPRRPGRNRSMPEPLRPIVIVDDESDDAFFTQRQMRKAGILNPVHVFTGGEDALRYLERICKGPISANELPCVVFLDVKMPRVSGHDVLAWARQQPALNEVKFVMLSSSDDPRDIARAQEMGADKYLIKHPPHENFRQFVQEVSCIKAA